MASHYRRYSRNSQTSIPSLYSAPRDGNSAHCLSPYIVIQSMYLDSSASFPQVICIMTRSNPFPVENPTTSFWRTQLDALDSHRSTDELPSEADIVIIGAGYSGAAVAHHLQEKTKGQTQKPSIVILRARQACSGATGRNGELGVWSYNDSFRLC